MTETQRTKPAPPRPEEFPHHARDVIRLGDLDHQNHVNNAVFGTYLETGRALMMRDLFGALSRDGDGLVLARVEIDFLRELHWPGEVVIGTRVARLGTSSVTLAQAVFTDGSCAAVGRSTMVRIDSRTRRSVPFTAEMAELLRSRM